MEITPGYIKSFSDLGYTNIRIQDIIPLKSMGVTAEYISSMKKKGFDYKDLNKYIQLKSLQD